MKENVGGFDRIFRIVVGIVVLVVGYLYHSWWGLIGLVPLMTGLMNRCLLYLPFGISTCKMKKQE